MERHTYPRTHGGKGNDIRLWKTRVLINAVTVSPYHGAQIGQSEIPNPGFNQKQFEVANLSFRPISFFAETQSDQCLRHN